MEKKVTYTLFIDYQVSNFIVFNNSVNSDKQKIK